MDFDKQKILVGLKFKQFRKTLGYSQEKLAELLDCDTSGISKVEQGKNFPSMETLLKYIHILKFNIFEVLEPKELAKPADELEDEILIERFKELSAGEKKKVFEIIDILRKKD